MDRIGWYDIMRLPSRLLFLFACFLSCLASASILPDFSFSLFSFVQLFRFPSKPSYPTHTPTPRSASFTLFHILPPCSHFLPAKSRTSLHMFNFSLWVFSLSLSNFLTSSFLAQHTYLHFLSHHNYFLDIFHKQTYIQTVDHTQTKTLMHTHQPSVSAFCLFISSLTHSLFSFIFYSPPSLHSLALHSLVHLLFPLLFSFAPSSSTLTLSHLLHSPSSCTLSLTLHSPLLSTLSFVFFSHAYLIAL